MWSGKVKEFIGLVANGGQTAALRAALEASGRRVGAFEERSWEGSLNALGDALKGAGVDDCWVSLECPMPGSNHRADAIILGETTDGQRQVVVIELKNWLRATGEIGHWVTFSDFSRIEGSF